MSDVEVIDAPSQSVQGNNSGTPKAPASKDNSFKSDKKKAGIELTAVESLLFFNIVRFNKDPAAVDWEQVAIFSNLKNAASAKVRCFQIHLPCLSWRVSERRLIIPRQVRFRQIQKKYNLEGPTPSGSTSNRKRKGVVEGPTAIDDDDDVEETPSHKAPARKRTSITAGRGKRAAKKNTTVHEQQFEDVESFGQDDPFVKKEAIAKASQVESFTGGHIYAAAAAAAALQQPPQQPSTPVVQDHVPAETQGLTAHQQPLQQPRTPGGHDHVHIKARAVAQSQQKRQQQQQQSYSRMMQNTVNPNDTVNFGTIQQAHAFDPASLQRPTPAEMSEWRHQQEVRQMHMRAQQQQFQQNQMYQSSMYSQGLQLPQHFVGVSPSAFHPSSPMAAPQMGGGSFSQAASQRSPDARLHTQVELDDATFAQFINMPPSEDDDNAIESQGLKFNLHSNEGELQFIKEQAADVKQEEDSSI